MHNQRLVEQAANKKFLRSIVAHDYTVPDDIDPFAFAKALLPNFASTDEELRDELSYMILAAGIIDAHKLTPEQVQTLLLTSLDDQHLFFRIGETKTDSVFMRSFSLLTINTLLYADAKAPSLPASAVQQTQAALFRYAQEEKDWRGYIEGKGWAHAMAHLADALDECAQNAQLTLEDRQQVMELIRNLAQRPDPLYHEEDMHLATVAYHIILAKQLDDEYLSAWLESCFVPRRSDVASWMSVTNVKNFLRSLYFLLLWDTIALHLTEQIVHILKKQDGLYVETGQDVEE